MISQLDLALGVYPFLSQALFVQWTTVEDYMEEENCDRRKGGNEERDCEYMYKLGGNSCRSSAILFPGRRRGYWLRTMGEVN